MLSLFDRLSIVIGAVFLLFASPFVVAHFMDVIQDELQEHSTANTLPPTFTPSPEKYDKR